MRKAATSGMESRKGIVLQAHMDMVPQKNGDKAFDFVRDPIEAYVDGEWVKADGTTLGADNGMGMAAILAVLESDDIEHGPIEALITATEETGMVGANGLKGGDPAGRHTGQSRLGDRGRAVRGLRRRARCVDDFFL